MPVTETGWVAPFRIPGDFCTDRCQKSYRAGASDAVAKCVNTLVEASISARETATKLVRRNDAEMVPRSKMFDAVSRFANNLAARLRGTPKPGPE